MNFIRTSLLGLLALPLAAQSTGFNVGASVITAPAGYFDSYSKVTNNDIGFIINAGYNTHVYETEIAARGTLSIGFMPGKDDHGLKTSLMQYQLAGDIFLDTALPELRGVVGLSINSYSASQSGTEGTDKGNAATNFPFKTCSGLKLGYRLGFEYAVNKQIAVEALLQQTELAGSQIAGDDRTRKGGINPAWLQLGVHYNF